MGVFHLNPIFRECLILKRDLLRSHTVATQMLTSVITVDGIRVVKLSDIITLSLSELANVEVIACAFHRRDRVILRLSIYKKDVRN